MTLRGGLAWYLALVHLVVGMVCGRLLWEQHRPWMLLLELGLVVSALIGWMLVRALATPREIVEIATQWIEEEDFSHAFHPRGTADVRRLVELYNRLVARLREERVRHLEQNIFLDRLLHASPSGVVTLDHDGRVELVNPAAERLLATAAHRVVGMFPAQADSELVRSLEKVPQDSARLVGQPGQRRLRCSRSHFFDRGFERSFFVIEDLTHELWESEKRAYQALIRTLAHEVNNTLGATGSILQSALGYADQLAESDKEDFVSALEVAIARTSHLGAFMRRYAEVVRLPEPTLRQVRPLPVVQRILRLMEPECRTRRIELELDSETDPEPLAMDEVQMEQVLVNLIRNAVEAVDLDGKIRVRLYHDGHGPVLAIEDSGPGLSDEARQNLFSPFYSSKPQGQGIGLTLVREILTRHGFAFSFSSPPGGPTVFLVSLSEGA